MADQSSGRDPKFNSGSDSGHHFKGTAHNQYQRTPACPKSEKVTNTQSNGAVGNTHGHKPAERSAVK